VAVAPAADARAADASAASSSTPAPIDESHFVSIRVVTHVSTDDLPPPAIDIAPGSPPGPGRPAGSVYVARRERDAAHVGEWDLATKTRLRDIQLPGSAPYDNMRIQHAGGALHVLMWVYNEDIAYVRVSEDLKAGRPEWLGQVSALGPAAMASDGAGSIVAFDGVLTSRRGVLSAHDPEGFFVASFDKSGRKIAQRRIDKMAPNPAEECYLKDNVAIAEGRVFVLVPTEQDDTLDLVRLGRSLDLQGVTVLHSEMTSSDGHEFPAPSPGVFASDGHVFVHWPDVPKMVDVSSNGPGSRRVTACAIAGETHGLHESWTVGVWVGDVHAKLWDDHDRTGILWSDPGVDQKPKAPCPPGL
jgi:hypothetical protein